MSTAVTFRTRGDGRLHGPGVTLSPAPNAHGCGSSFCTADGDLFRVELAGQEPARVLCTEHAAGYITQSRGWS